MAIVDSLLPATDGDVSATTAQPVVVYVEPPLTAKVLITVLMFFLTYNTPQFWFIAESFTPGLSNSGPPPPQGFFAFGLIALLGIGLAMLGGNVTVLFAIAAREPLLPAFVGFICLSMLWSADPFQTVRVATPLVLLLIIGYWIAAQFVLSDILLAFCLAFAAGTILNYLWIFGLPAYGDSVSGWAGVFDNKNSLGRVAVLAALHFLIAAGVFPRYRFFWRLMFVLAAIQVFGTTSGTAIGSLVLLIGLFVVFRAFRARRTLYGAVIVSMGVAMGTSILLATANLGIVTAVLGKDVTLTGRTDLWQSSLGTIAKRPIGGYGWGGFWNGWFSPSREVLLGRDWVPANSHNAMIEWLLAIGVVGTAIGLALFIRLGIRSARTIRVRPGMLAMWPMLFFSYAVLNSITELGIIGRDPAFLLLVIMVSVVVTSADAEGPQAAKGTVTQ